MHDLAYQSYNFCTSELKHHYGPNVHLLADPVLLTQLAQLCRPETLQPDISYLVRDLYQSLVRTVLAAQAPRADLQVRTRMFTATPNGVLCGSGLQSDGHVITVDIARAGTLPSQVVFETLTRLLSPDAVRQDHVYMNRVCDAAGTVVGVSVAGSKIGGSAAKAIVLLPDPMGATGGSMIRCIDMYKALDGGAPHAIIAMHLVVTPEYLMAMHRAHPDVLVYSVRLDRGMSPPEVLKTELGARWSDERGLNSRQYIVPGAGGLGEVLNNSYV